MLLAFDLDNTVVTTEDRRLPDDVVDAIDASRRLGHHVTVLTGRPHLAALPFAERLGVVPGPYSVHHGALVFGPDGGVLKRRRLAGDHVRAVLADEIVGRDVAFACIVDDTLHVADPTNPRWSWAHVANRRVERIVVDEIVEADKIVIDGLGSIRALESRVRATVDVTTYAWGDGYLEITATDADKGSALALIASTLGIAREDVVAFGDGSNDVTMLAWAGRGIAVGPHAVEEVLAVADEHVSSPEESGVARWIERNLL